MEVLKVVENENLVEIRFLKQTQKILAEEKFEVLKRIFEKNYFKT